MINNYCMINTIRTWINNVETTNICRIKKIPWTFSDYFSILDVWQKCWLHGCKYNLYSDSTEIKYPVWDVLWNWWISLLCSIDLVLSVEKVTLSRILKFADGSFRFLQKRKKKGQESKSNKCISNKTNQQRSN